MRRFLFNRWFVLGFLLLTSLSAFSFVAYRKARNACDTSHYRGKAGLSAQDAGIPWDAFSSPFSSISPY